MMFNAISKFPMQCLNVWLGLAAFALLLAGFASKTSAATIFFEATDLPDTTFGEDLWQYSYTPVDCDFTAGQGFTIFFERAFFTQLQSPPPLVNAGWDAITVQPDPALNSNGFYDALALSDAPSLADPFTVSVVWLGPGAPGPQPFTIYDTDFQPSAQGATTNIPEPAGSFLIFTAMALTGLRRRRRAA